MRTTVIALIALLCGGIIGGAMVWPRAYEAGSIDGARLFRQPATEEALGVVLEFTKQGAVKPESVAIEEWLAVPCIGVKARIRATARDESVQHYEKSFFIANGGVAALYPPAEADMVDAQRSENELLLACWAVDDGDALRRDRALANSLKSLWAEPNRSDGFISEVFIKKGTSLDDLKACSQFRDLKAITFTTMDLTPAHVEAMLTIRTLENLRFEGVTLSKSETAPLAKMKFSRVRFIACDLRGAGLQWLRGNRDVELELNRCKVDGASLGGLKGEEIKTVEIVRCDGEAKELESLVALKSVARLQYWAGAVDGAALSRLAQVPGLTDLNLSYTSLDDVGLAQVARMKGLKRVSILNTKVTPQGIQEAKRINPELRMDQVVPPSSH